MDAKRSELKREFGMGDPYWDPEPKPPPRLYAVWVCHVPLGNWEGDKPSCRKPGDRPAICVKPPVGCDRFRRLNDEYQNKRNYELDQKALNAHLNALFENLYLKI